MKIYVELLNEGTDVWFPVEAVQVGGDVYQIVAVNEQPEDTQWAFGTGELVRCQHRNTGEGERILVAYERAAS